MAIRALTHTHVQLHVDDIQETKKGSSYQGSNEHK